MTGGMAAGAAVGGMTGPVGAVVGAALGAAAGALVGKVAAVDPEEEEAYWRAKRVTAALDTQSELDRALRVSDAEITDGGHRIHKVDNRFAVAVNVRQWNAELLDPKLATVWGRRRVSYFVYDQASRLFAPSKFCAFVPTVKTASAANLPALLEGRPAGMTMPIYASLGEGDKRFDGAIAWKHLHQVLGYDLWDLSSAGHGIKAEFERWRAQSADVLDIRAPKLLLPPARV